MALTFQHDFPLERFNTFGLPCRARRYAEILTTSQLAALCRQNEPGPDRVLVLGGGSNLLLPAELDATVLRMAIAGRERIGSDDDYHFVRAGAGEDWHDFVRWTLKMGWPGLENLSLIPGTVGAAPVQNIGAYGLEIHERFFGLEAVDLRSGEVISLDAAACRFGYRDSLFKHEGAGRFAITSVTFRLPKRWTPLTRYQDVAHELAAGEIANPSALDVSDAIIAIRSRKLPDPAKLGNAGSFFKNPVVEADHFARLLAEHPKLPNHAQADGRVKLAAGWLIEQAGWKGRALGRVGMYEGQALVMVNHGGASLDEVRALATAVHDDVAARFGVGLEIEPVQP